MSTALKVAGTQPRDALQRQRHETTEARQFAEDKTRAWKLGLFAIGRVFLGVVFMVSALEKLTDPGGTTASLSEAAVDVHRLIPAAIAFELTAGVLLALGLGARLAALAAVAYVVLAVLLVHPDLTFDLGRDFTLANLALISALLMVAAHGGGVLSIDRALERRGRRRHAQA